MCISIFFFLLIRRPPGSSLFPSRRSSDLGKRFVVSSELAPNEPLDERFVKQLTGGDGVSTRGNYSREGNTRWQPDRKSTRLNSSHPSISYAVFCLKKKKHDTLETVQQDRH